MNKLRTAVLSLSNEEVLSPQYRDHSLKGEWNGYRDLHLEQDRLLIYEIKDGALGLARTGTHADIFKK